MSNKILPAIFVILFFVLIGEVVYLFLTSKNNQPQNISPSVVNVTGNNKKETQRNGIQAVNDQTVENIKMFNKEVIRSSILENQFQGKIIEIKKEPQGQKVDFSYVLKIRIKGNKETNSFYFNDQEVNKIKIKNENNYLSVDDLKVGDEIIINERLDLLKDINANLISLEIIKL